MADTKISALTAATVINGTDEIPINEAGTTKKITVNQLFTAPVQQSYEDYTAIAEPAAPSAGVGRQYGKSIGGRIQPKWKGPTDTNGWLFQASLASRAVTLWLAGSGTTAAISFNVVWSVTATQAHPTPATTNVMTSIMRATFTTTTTAANSAGISSSGVHWFRGNAARVGGFFFFARHGILTYSSTMRIFVGLGSAVVGATDPSAMASMAGMSKDTGETVWQCLNTNGTPTATKNSTGRTTAAAANAEVFDFFMYMAPNGASLTFRVVDVATDTILVDEVVSTTNLPVVSTGLIAQAMWVNVTGGAGTSVAGFLSKMYIETEL